MNELKTVYAPEPVTSRHKLLGLCKTVAIMRGYNADRWDRTHHELIKTQQKDELRRVGLLNLGESVRKRPVPNERTTALVKSVFGPESLWVFVPRLKDLSSPRYGLTDLCLKIDPGEDRLAALGAWLGELVVEGGVRLHVLSRDHTLHWRDSDNANKLPVVGTWKREKGRRRTEKTAPMWGRWERHTFRREGGPHLPHLYLYTWEEHRWPTQALWSARVPFDGEMKVFSGDEMIEHMIEPWHLTNKGVLYCRWAGVTPGVYDPELRDWIELPRNVRPGALYDLPYPLKVNVRNAPLEQLRADYLKWLYEQPFTFGPFRQQLRQLVAKRQDLVKSDLLTYLLTDDDNFSKRNRLDRLPWGHWDAKDVYRDTLVQGEPLRKPWDNERLRESLKMDAQAEDRQHWTPERKGRYEWSLTRRGYEDRPDPTPANWQTRGAFLEKDLETVMGDVYGLNRDEMPARSGETKRRRELDSGKLLEDLAEKTRVRLHLRRDAKSLARARRLEKGRREQWMLKASLRGAALNAWYECLECMDLLERMSGTDYLKRAGENGRSPYRELIEAHKELAAITRRVKRALRVPGHEDVTPARNLHPALVQAKSKAFCRLQEERRRVCELTEA